MVTHYDDKGKIFTNVVNKQAVTVFIQTVSQRIFGVMYVRDQLRIKDELNQDEHFLAVTNAQVIGVDGNVLYETDFIAVNRDQIIWVIPEEELHSSKGDRGGGE